MRFLVFAVVVAIGAGACGDGGGDSVPPSRTDPTTTAAPQAAARLEVDTERSSDEDAPMLILRNTGDVILSLDAVPRLERWTGDAWEALAPRAGEISPLRGTGLRPGATHRSRLPTWPLPGGLYRVAWHLRADGDDDRALDVSAEFTVGA